MSRPGPQRNRNLCNAKQNRYLEYIYNWAMSGLPTSSHGKQGRTTFFSLEQLGNANDKFCLENCTPSLLNGHEMKTQNSILNNIRTPKALAFTILACSGVFHAGATVTAYTSLNSAVTSRGDTLVAGAGFARSAGGLEYLGAPGAAPFYTLPKVATGSLGALVSFVFAYDPTGKNFEFKVGSGSLYTSSATAPQLALIGSMTGFYFELDRPNDPGATASISGLSLKSFDQMNVLSLGGTSFALSGTDLSQTAYINSAALSGGFWLSGTVDLSSDLPKSQFRVFTGSTPVPEASTVAFGAALVGGLVLVEARRKASKVGAC
jgi:hypothetical protein